MEDQNAVNTPVETTTPADSAPAQTETITPQITPTESNPAEKKVSEAVPYDRFSEVNAKAKTLEEENRRLREQMTQTQVSPVTPDQYPSLDPESQAAVERLFDQKLEAKKVEQFVTKHKDDLADPVLAGTVSQLIGNARNEGRYLDQEDALAQAKDLLDKRTQPKVTEAKTEAFQEGQDLAKQKALHGAVGTTSQSAIEKDDDSLTAAEFAAKYKLPTVY